MILSVLICIFIIAQWRVLRAPDDVTYDDIRRKGLEHTLLCMCELYQFILNISQLHKDWDKAFILTHRLSLWRKTQETNVKICTIWYRYHSTLYQMFPLVTGQCCHNHPGTMLHTWWSSTPITIFWDTILTPGPQQLLFPIPPKLYCSLCCPALLKVLKRHCSTLSHCSLHHCFTPLAMASDT